VLDDGSHAALPRRFAVGFAGVAFVTDDSARPNVGSDVDEDIEVTRVGGFAACQVEGDIPGGARFRVDFRGEAAARATERLALLPPFAPSADTCARTIVESNIRIRCAEGFVVVVVCEPVLDRAVVEEFGGSFTLDLVAFVAPAPVESDRVAAYSTSRPASRAPNATSPPRAVIVSVAGPQRSR
jgi:hypothetical protein